MKRRRFLHVLAAAMAFPARADTLWRGRAFGADLVIQTDGPAPMRAILSEIAAIEAAFSLMADSELTRLNARGQAPGSARMRAVLAQAAQVHVATGGAFDPTVQPLWQALAQGGDGRAARGRIGFDRLRIGRDIRLAPGQALTLNGIAQGHAADRIRAICAAQGLRHALIDMGEFAAIGGAFRLGIEDPQAGLLGWRSLTGGAMATSSPAALSLPGGSHILGPRGEVPLWSTVTVQGPEAAICDAASTAFVLMPEPAIRKAAAALGLWSVLLVDAAGDLREIALT